jgi:hypothetical protein
MKNIFCLPCHAVLAVRARQVCFLLLSWSWLSCVGASPLFVCPGNLFSNNLDPQQALAMGCKSVQPGGVSQAFGTPSATDAPVTSAAAAPVALPAALATAPLAMSARKPSAHDLGNDAIKQRQRDSHAREIIQSELARTQAHMQTLSTQPAGPETDTALQRLRGDEAALLRELARRPS